jgi:transcriptional regulator with XRE-family HTH domain
MIKGTDLRTRRRGLGLTQEDLAEVLDVTGRTVQRWEAGDVPIPRTLDFALNALEALAKDELRALVDGRQDVV